MRGAGGSAGTTVLLLRKEGRREGGRRKLRYSYVGLVGKFPSVGCAESSAVLRRERKEVLCERGVVHHIACLQAEYECGRANISASEIKVIN